jgi:uncharacterized short protein YbdD (DUF466 family)
MRDRQTDGLRGEAVWRGVLSAIRQIAGMPDYAAYADHYRRCHPDRPVPTQRDFYEEFVRARYDKGSTRCC